MLPAKTVRRNGNAPTTKCPIDSRSPPCSDAGREVAMKRGLLLVGIVLVLSLAGGAFTWWAFAPDPLEHRLAELRPGMTTAEVESILGEPYHIIAYPETGRSTHKWVTDRVIVMVLFDAEGRLDRTMSDRRPLWDRVHERFR